MNMNIILDILCHKKELEYYLLKKMNIFKYWNILEYLKEGKNTQLTATYKSEDCG